MTSPILWQNSDRIVALIDVPLSISAAQGGGSLTWNRNLLSCPPLQSPFPSNEPKSDEAKAKLKNNTVDAELHAEYHVLLQQALEDVKKGYDREWCLPRSFAEEAPRAAKRRKLSSRDESFSGQATAELDFGTSKDPRDAGRIRSGILAGLAPDGFTVMDTRVLAPSSRTEPESGEDAGEASQTMINFFSNENDEVTRLQFSRSNEDVSFNFLIPPHSNFYLGNCADSRSFHMAVRKQAQDATTRRHFDFVLLDPPWPSRSVKRLHKTAGSTYATSPTLLDVRRLILDTELNVLMADDCLVGIWITNKPAIRDLVLGEDGIFACFDVELVEEWLWLKTTVHGEPVTPLDGLWRKPYEVLLLGRKHRRLASAGSQNVVPRAVERRVVISVPDLHSRKPCLKELIEPLMHDSAGYRALELFARYLVAGWWSWGDECIKFNQQSLWQNSSDIPKS